MKTKTISKVLSTKFKDFLASIEDEALRDRVSKGAIITGGSIASMLLREPVNDYDIYFNSRQLAADVARYYVEQFKKNPPETFKDGGEVTVEVQEIIEGHRLYKGEERVRIFIQSAGIVSEEKTGEYQYFEGQPDFEGDEYVDAVAQALDKCDEVPADALDSQKPKYRPIFLTANAITLSDKVQLVIRFFGDAEQIHENYDFVHCTNYWTHEGGLVLRKEAMESLLTKELRYVGSKYPLCSIIRTRKFVQRQWTINAGQYLKMAFQVSQLDLCDLTVLEDQLIGVDSAYFMDVIRRLHEKDPQRVNGAYLVSIIDRIF